MSRRTHHLDSLLRITERDLTINEFQQMNKGGSKNPNQC